jgi:mRNA-degrading endonuclease YafQ of YafQ-DinJ toxin-antitoxin module
LKPLALTESFRVRVRSYSKEQRNKIGTALKQLERGFGDPHSHHGLGIRKLRGDYFEIRCGLDIRLVFKNQTNSLLFVLAGNHDEVRKFLRGL